MKNTLQELEIKQIELRKKVLLLNNQNFKLINKNDTLHDIELKINYIHHNIIFNNKYLFRFSKYEKTTNQEQVNEYINVYNSSFTKDLEKQIEVFKSIFEFLYYLYRLDLNDQMIIDIINKYNLILTRTINFLDTKDYKYFEHDYSITEFFNDYKDFISVNKIKANYLNYRKQNTLNIDEYLDIAKREKEQFFWKYQTIKWVGGAAIGFIISTILHNL